MLKYTEYGYLWPPRPEQAIPDSMLANYEAQGWSAQVKKNGTCTLVFSNGTDVVFKTRHNEDHKAWSPGVKHKTFFRNLSQQGQWCVFEAELLHSKGNSVKDTLYIFDILVWQGEYLVGTTFGRRQELLQEVFKDKLQKGNDDHWVIEPLIWLARPLKNFKETWDSLVHSEDEGLVLKDPNAKLKLCNKPNSNNNWQLKCRRPHKNYGF